MIIIPKFMPRLDGKYENSGHADTITHQENSLMPEETSKNDKFGGSHAKAAEVHLGLFPQNINDANH